MNSVLRMKPKSRDKNGHVIKKHLLLTLINPSIWPIDWNESSFRTETYRYQMKLGCSTSMQKYHQIQGGKLNFYPFTVPTDAKFQ